ncbi:hypothetical protein [Microbacterium sp. SS28]|uniref:hypothetical protein n=1 Tax=Microbacterium sp. SS28 TaxID=2919948 RepID=UPI001FAADA50|nr:hypothetical protein [Microbacterium sp. SS28]
MDAVPARELERNSAPDSASAQPATPPASDETESTPPRRRWAWTRSPVLWVAAGVGLVAAYGVASLWGPHPDASLQATAGESDPGLVALAGYLNQEVDPATLTPYETFRGVEPWSGVDYYGNPCLLVIERSSQYLVGGACAPAGADVLVDVGAWRGSEVHFDDDLPIGTVIRFHLRADSVDVFVYPIPVRD